MTSRKRQAAETKHKILQEAMELFRETDYDKVSVADIARAAEVSIGAFYHHFKNKEEIVHFVLVNFDDTLEEKYEYLINDGPIDNLYSLYDYKALITELAGITKMKLILNHQIQAKDKYIFREDRFFNVKTREIVAECIEKGLLVGDVAEISNQLVHFLYGISYAWVVADGNFNVHARVKMSVKMITEHYAPKCPQ